jgi:sec-independent protein translocase protein TatB
MFDLGMGELLVIGIVALIVIGPKDLPGMFQTLGRFTAKLRAMSRDFSRAMEQAAKETGVNEVARDLKSVANPKAMGLDAVKGAADRFEKWDPLKNAAKPSVAPLTPPPMAAAAPATAPVTALGPRGPATTALAEQKAAKAAIAREAAEKMRAVAAAPPAPEPEPAPAKKPGRTRTKKPAPAGDPA